MQEVWHRRRNLSPILRECEDLPALSHVYLGFFFLDPEDIKNLRVQAIWSFSKETGLP
jgi:hypothetical protein